VNRSWEYFSKKVNELDINDFPEDTMEYFNLKTKIDDLVVDSMGIPSDEYEKILRQAEEMMSPFDPDKTFYKRCLTRRHIENNAKFFYKQHPGTTLIID